jgi:hypothetical protein
VDTKKISPGTSFMIKVKEALKYLACKYVLQFPELDVFVSGIINLSYSSHS